MLDNDITHQSTAEENYFAIVDDILREVTEDAKPSYEDQPTNITSG